MTLADAVCRSMRWRDHLELISVGNSSTFIQFTIPIAE